ncbi:hypothetical protein [Eubacterium sp.]|uniref:hypothetical protein n=1 Tax=Eubacterium sp. TaxID=142586 RepID=UPI002FC9042E
MIRIRISYDEFSEVETLICLLQEELPGYSMKRQFRKDGSGRLYLAPAGQFEKDREWIHERSNHH